MSPRKNPLSNNAPWVAVTSSAIGVRGERGLVHGVRVGKDSGKLEKRIHECKGQVRWVVI